MVVTMGGFTTDAHIAAERRPAMYERIARALARLDTGGIRLAAQTLPPYPWLMGGQQFHNLFLDPADTAEFARSTGVGLCLDISHSKLAANHLRMPFSEAVELLAPYAVHLHLVDAKGVDGEGVQVGEGEVDWGALAQQLDRLAPGVGFIPEIWQGHVNSGEGFWTALERLEQWF
jgi:N-acetylneuraminate synthase